MEPTDHLAEAKSLLDAEAGAAGWPIDIGLATAHAMVDIAESLRVLAQNAGTQPSGG